MGSCAEIDLQALEKLVTDAPVLPESIMACLDGRSSPTRRERVKKVLDTLVATGAARTGELEGQTRYFVAR